MTDAGFEYIEFHDGRIGKIEMRSRAVSVAFDHASAYVRRTRNVLDVWSCEAEIVICCFASLTARGAFGFGEPISDWSFSDRAGECVYLSSEMRRASFVESKLEFFDGSFLLFSHGVVELADISLMRRYDEFIE